MGPNGVLYIEDVRREEILKRLPDGRFKVAVGTGADGYSGDGGRATRAEIDIRTSSSMVEALTGVLYFVQQRSKRFGHFSTVVRKVTPNGRISTVIGAHPKCNAAEVQSQSTPAQHANLSGGSLAITPNGALAVLADICPPQGPTHGPELLSLTADGRLVNAPQSSTVAKANNGNCNGGLAYSGTGTVYLACYVGGPGSFKGLLQIEPDGQAKRFPGNYPSYDGPDWLTGTPTGTVLTLDFGRVMRLTSQGPKTVVDLGTASNRKIFGTVKYKAEHYPRQMIPNGAAEDRSGDIYLASTSGLGDGTYTGIIEVHNTGRIQVLWSSPGASY